MLKKQEDILEEFDEVLVKQLIKPSKSCPRIKSLSSSLRLLEIRQLCLVQSAEERMIPARASR
ncbi:hypothetical protein [Petroclostridium sp. X23]|uniref:hypothetical protein n=1 Tax=Petroclostridium sp. X23 TaxID=3045146 RepID=UPI0024ACC5F3|nr:hypothetical protein [Petroclostridium sp. X23]WHH61794.1 hypothetical protein QKW49_18150 [Petroclostridium sp. X23]